MPRAVVMLGVLAMLWGCGTAGSALAIFTKQATVTANTLGAAAAFPRCYGDAVLADTPVSYWRLDESSGTSAADSKGSNTGTYTGGVTLGQAGALPDTINNKAAGFDGVNDYVSLGNAASLQLTTGTVEVWVKTANAGAGSHDIIDKRAAYALYLNNNVLSTYDWGGGGGGLSTGVNLADNSWHQVALSFQSGVGNGTKVYVDGVLRLTTTTTNTDQSYALWLGNESGQTEYFPGSIDEASVYNTVLTAAQIRTHYNAGRCYKDGILADSPVGYWRLGETSGTTGADGIAGRHGTYTNGPTLNQTGALTGDTNTSVGFDGVNDYVDVPYAAPLNPAQFTIEAWAKVTGGAGTYRSIATSWATPSNDQGYWLGVDSSNVWAVYVGDGVGFGNVTGPSVVLNSWAHLAASYDGATLRFYVNGILAGSVATTAYTPNPSPVPFEIGTQYKTGTRTGFFPGSIDDVAVYSSPLSLARIQAHYLLGRSYQDTVLDSGPVSYWRLGESSGTSAADAKGTNTGTYTNGPTLAQPAALAGDADTAVSFDGSNDYVIRAYTAALNPAQFTVEAWVKPTGGQGTDRAAAASWWDVSGSIEQGYWIGAAADNAWHFQIGTGGSPTLNEVTGPAITLNAWTHLVGTYDGTTARMYVNGTLAGSVTTAYTANTSKAFLIGAEKPGNQVDEFFLGVIDDVAVYNRALTATEVQLHYDSGRQ